MKRAEVRQAEIEAELAVMGLRMEASLSSLDEEGHAIVEIESGECIDPPNTTALELAEEWSLLVGLPQH